MDPPTVGVAMAQRCGLNTERKAGMKNKGILVLSMVAAVLMSTGCQKETPVEKAKDALDMRDHEKLKDAGEDARDAVQDAAEGVKDAAKGKD